MVTSVEASLRALQTDRIDVLLIHRPDLLLDPEEPGETFRYLKASGRVLQVGVSNHSPAQFEIVRKCHPLVTNQIEFPPLQMGALEDGTLEQCVDLGLRPGLRPMAWSPLGGGRLIAGEDEQAQRVRDVLGDLGPRYCVSAATMAYAWILRHPARPIPITGSGRIESLARSSTRIASSARL